MPDDNAANPTSNKPRLIACFDGTWSTPEDNTNISRLFGAIADNNNGCPDQLKFYDPGVGTSLGSRLAGGVLGWGLDENILQAYCWLINHYDPGANQASVTESDGEKFAVGQDIFLFGFSRGAYTARSLAGLINRCGLLRRDRLDTNGAQLDSGLVQKAWELYRQQYQGKDARTVDPWQSFREKNAHNVKIRFIGVWDTVGALGIPMFRSALFPFARDRYQFHDMEIGRVIENAYHAVAVDEHREDYQVTLWTKAHKDGHCHVEQRWFPGAHSNVGGGYEDDLLPDISLKWMAEKALVHGIEFTTNLRLAPQPGQSSCAAKLPADFELDGDEILAPVRDSYGEFLLGLYRIARFPLGGRHYRPMLVSGIDETVDESVNLKWAKDARYRPRNYPQAGSTRANPSTTGKTVSDTAAPSATP